MTNLQELNLYGTAVTGSGLVHSQGLTNLRWLNLSGTQITDAGLGQLKGLTSLRTLRLNDTQVTDAGIVHLKGLTPRAWRTVPLSSLARDADTTRESSPWERAGPCPVVAPDREYQPLPWPFCKPFKAFQGAHALAHGIVDRINDLAIRNTHTRKPGLHSRNRG